MEFSALINDSISQSETSQQSREQIDALLEENPLDFMVSLVKVPLELQDSNLLRVCITVLYSIALHRNYLEDASILVEFWNFFSGLIQQILVDPNCFDDVKQQITNIVAILIVNFRKINSESVELQSFLIALLQSDERCISYVLNMISMILYASPDLGGYTPENLIPLLELQQFPLSVINLYFAIATHYDENGDIHEKFDYILQLIDSTEENKEKIYSILDNFAETNPLFFSPHLEVFCGYINNVMKATTDDSIKIHCIYIFQGLAVKATEMCIKNPLYYEPMIDGFITVMSQVTEESSYDYDESDLTLASAARYSFNVITRSIDSEEVIDHFCEIFNQILSSETETGLEYGVIIAIAEATLWTFNDRIDPSALISIMSGEYSPRIKYAAMEALQSIDFLSNIRVQDDYAEILSTLFEVIKTVDIEALSISCSRLIKIFFKRTRYDLCNSILDEAYAFLKELIEACECEPLLANLIDCISKLFEKSSNLSQEHIVDFCTFLNQIIEAIDSNLIKAHAYNAFARVAYFNDVSKIEGFDELINTYFQLGGELQVAGFADSKLNSKMSASNMYLISKLGDAFQEYAGDFIGHIFETISNVPEIEECAASEQIISSIYYYIPNPPLGKYLYVEKSLITEYENSFDLLSTAADNLKENFVEYLEDSLTASIQLLEMEHPIEPLMTSVLYFFSNVIYALKSDTAKVAEVLDIIIPKVIQQINFDWSPNGFKCIILVSVKIVEILRYLASSIEVNNELFLQFLPLTKIINAKLNEMRKIERENQEKFDCIEDDKKNISVIEEAMENNIKLFGRIEKMFTEEAIEFFRSNLLEDIKQELEIPYMQKEAFSFLSRFICCSNSEAIFVEFKEPFISYIVSISDGDGNRPDDPVLEPVLLMFDEFFFKNKLSREVAVEMHDFFTEFQLKELLLDDIVPFDCMLCAITNLLLKNVEYFDIMEEYDTWCRMIPLNVESKYGFNVVHLLIFYLANLYGTKITEEKEEGVLGFSIYDIFAYIGGMILNIPNKNNVKILVRELLKAFHFNQEIFLLYRNLRGIEEYKSEYLSPLQEEGLRIVDQYIGIIIKEQQQQTLMQQQQIPQ